MTTFRNATPQELRVILDWAADEGWNPGLDDARAFFPADPEGFFVAVDGSDHPVAAISVVNHSDSFAFLGLYLVVPEHRGKGIGYALWQHAMSHAGNRTVGLDGVEAQQQNYVASGFAHAGGTTRFSGAISGRADPGIRLATAADIPVLVGQEAEASGVAKPRYLSAWFTQHRHRTTLVSMGDGGLNGFCTIRACRSGTKIGPLVADDAAVAQRLIAHSASLTEGPITLDVPATSTALSSVCESYGLTAGFRTARMYRGPFSAPRHENFAVVSLELG
ncbi:GNAT family N-acetyltransferase [Roseovarius sp. CAU 1744]|uniref:GNAT family N-acetyltransferase n=1 Tax=Roseovarius sp. CAU 1744 TaxID=3140368 RepID=UPI00325B8A88